MENKGTDLIIENVKIDKIVKTYIREEWLQSLQECQSHCQKDRKEFIYVYCNCKRI
jgi:hypothetical protein